jgi:dephospho-CoA kinase
MKLIGIMGNSGSGKTTFTEYLNTKPTVGVIHIDDLTGEVKKKYFWMFLQAKEKNTTEANKKNPKLKTEVKAIFYKNKFLFNLLMGIRNSLFNKELNKKLDEFKKQGKSLVVIDDWAITTQKKLLPKLSHIYYMNRSFEVRRQALKTRDAITTNEAKIYDLPYALKYVCAPKENMHPEKGDLYSNMQFTQISNNGTFEELYQKAEEVYRDNGELTFDERYSLRSKVGYRDVAIKLGKIKPTSDIENDFTKTY